MAEPLRYLLLGLVLVNLAFVQVTGSVSNVWMAGLWSLAAAAPVLRRWHERFVYVGMWNAAVLAAFAFLVHDAMTSGLLHMLEDGLLLASLCQVHLLNNIGKRQRPDLLFFNSFLIAFVTSFFSHDIGWSIAFVVYAALLVPTLQVHVVLPRDGSATRGELRAVLRDSVPRSAAAVLLTAVVFAVWPRDFQREGWLGDTLRFTDQSLVAFAEEIRLDRTTTPTLGDTPVMRLQPASGLPDDVPHHWRGVTFVHFDGAGWQPYRVRDFGTRTATDTPWRGQSPQRWSRPGEPRPGHVDVRLIDLGSALVFLPLDACDVELTDGAQALLDPKADGVVAIDPLSLGRGDLHLRVRLGPPRLQEQTQLTRTAEILLRRVPPRLPSAMQALVEDLRKQVPADAQPVEVAEHCRTWLQHNRRYALPGTPGATRSLDDFLLGTGAGHCEYFATALALLLRVQGIPCRVVGGYLAHEWDETRREVVVRQRDAHAWVEAWVAGRWTTFDATPPNELERGPLAASWWEIAWKGLQDAWISVTTFDAGRRARLFAGLAAMPGRVATWFHNRPLVTVTVCAALAWWLRRRRRGDGPASVRDLSAAMRRAHVLPRDGETPRDVLARAREQAGEIAATTRLAAAVAAHEAHRYGVHTASRR